MNLFILVIGGPFNDANGDSSGHVRVYAWNGADWAGLDSDIDGEAAGDQSSLPVAISSDGSILAIWAN